MQQTPFIHFLPSNMVGGICLSTVYLFKKCPHSCTYRFQKHFKVFLTQCESLKIVSCPEKLRTFQNLLDMVLLSRLIQIVAVDPAVKEISFSKEQFQLKPSFMRSDGGQ